MSTEDRRADHQAPPMEHFVDVLGDHLAQIGGRLETRRRRRVRAMRAVTAVSAVVVVATAVGVHVGSDGGDGPGGLGVAQAAAAERCRTPSSSPRRVRACLGALGTVAADWEAPGDGDVAYEQRWSIGATSIVRPDGRPTAYSNAPGSFRIAFPTTTDAWVAPDGAGQTTINPLGDPFLPTARDRERWRAAGSPSLGERPPTGGVSGSGPGITTTADGRVVERWSAGDAQEHLLQVGAQGEDGGPTLFDGQDPTATLSRDPTRLLEELRRLAWRQRVVISGESCPNGFGRCSAATERNISDNVGTLATGLLSYPATPRPLRAALVRALADLPGAATLGPGKDPTGRPGTVVRLPDGVNDGQNLLLFDVSSARLLAQGTSRDSGEDDPLWGTLYAVRAARVQRAGELP
jgi:hypothetical protein